MFSQTITTIFLSALVAFPPSTSAGPIPPTTPVSAAISNVLFQTTGITEQQLLQIAPKSSTCDGAPFPLECRPASKIYPFLNSAFTLYGITSAGEKAALISLQAFESAEFKYNKNHYPGRPGQGTSAMLMPNFISEYATSLADVGGKASGLAPDAILQLINDVDAYSFGSAAWFLTTQCGAEHRAGLQAGTLAGWANYITGCVGTSVTADRTAYWTKAMTALGSSAY